MSSILLLLLVFIVVVVVAMAVAMAVAVAVVVVVEGKALGNGLQPLMPPQFGAAPTTIVGDEQHLSKRWLIMSEIDLFLLTGATFES